MTRADWYARHNSGGWRTARKPRRCEQPLCTNVTPAGAQYFDTNQACGTFLVNGKPVPRTKKICACCANESV